MLKTLVVQVDGKPACIVLSCDREASMKKVAVAFQGEVAEMARPADAERLTGYRIGGVSPLGQRRCLPTVVDTATIVHPRIYLNAGQRGLQIALAPRDLVQILGAIVAQVS